MERIIWNGENTEKVVRFCVDWDAMLCCIYREFRNLSTGVRTLEIEPADTMRGSSIYIPLNKQVIRMNDNNRRWLKIEN